MRRILFHNCQSPKLFCQGAVPACLLSMVTHKTPDHLLQQCEGLQRVGSRGMWGFHGEEHGAQLEWCLQYDVLSAQVSCNHYGPRGMAGALAAPGTVNGLLPRVIKTGLKINSLLQCTAVVAQPCATDSVPGLSPKRN